MRCYQTIRRTPLNELTIAEHGALNLEMAMLSIRQVTNEIRTKHWMTSRDKDYAQGFFNGVRFMTLMALNYWDPGYKDFEELADRYATEVDYLCGSYLDGKEH
jgi:hypothetical protein